MSYPILYDAPETDFGHLGLGILKDAISCFVTEERNGRFQLEMRYPINGFGADLIKYDNLIKADAGHALKDQLFRIEVVEKSDDGMINVSAKHVSYLANNLVLKPKVQIGHTTASVALGLWRNSIEGHHPFTVSSNITENRSTVLDIRNHQNARQALGGVDGSILSVWGGEYRFDNYHINLLGERGGRANTLISYGRNITDLTQEENIANTYTSIYPYAIYRNSDVEEVITLSEESGLLLHSENAEKFAHYRVLPVDFSREFENNERPTTARLLELAEAYLVANEIGVPQVSINLRFVDLAKALNAGGLTYEQLNLCDNVPVRFEKLGIDTVAKVVRIEWDVLLDQYDTLEIGQMRASLSDTVRRIEREVGEVTINTDTAMRAANGKNTVFYGPTEPVATRVGDLWYRPNGGNTELWMWHGSGWNFIMSTAPDEELLKQLNEARQNVERATEKANAAVERADELFNETEPFLFMDDPITGERTSIRAVSEGLQLAVNGANGIESRITQLSGDINLRVAKNDVINQINVSEEGILLDGHRVHITGLTTIDDAVIQAAHIGSINADQITTGTLNAADVNIINLNGNSIVANSIHGSSIRAGTLTSQHITSEHIRVGLEGIYKGLRLTETGLKFINDTGDPIFALTNRGLMLYEGQNRGTDIGFLVENEGLVKVNSQNELRLMARESGLILDGREGRQGVTINAHSDASSPRLILSRWISSRRFVSLRTGPANNDIGLHMEGTTATLGVPLNELSVGLSGSSLGNQNGAWLNITASEVLLRTSTAASQPHLRLGTSGVSVVRANGGGLDVADANAQLRLRNGASVVLETGSTATAVSLTMNQGSRFATLTTGIATLDLGTSLANGTTRLTALGGRHLTMSSTGIELGVSSGTTPSLTMPSGNSITTLTSGSNTVGGVNITSVNTALRLRNASIDAQVGTGTTRLLLQTGSVSHLRADGGLDVVAGAGRLDLRNASISLRLGTATNTGELQVLNGISFLRGGTGSDLRAGATAMVQARSTGNLVVLNGGTTGARLMVMTSPVRVQVDRAPFVVLSNTATATNFITSSSRELKKTIEPLNEEMGLPLLKGLDLKSYKYKDTTSDYEACGVIYEETDERIKYEETEGVDTTKVLWSCVMAIQQLSKQIEEIRGERNGQ